MSTDIQTQIQHQAQELLTTNFTPPGRYGTAFHITSPVSDVRTLSQSVHAFDMEAWEQLIKEEQEHFLRLSPDPYLLWHLSHKKNGETRLIYIPSGATQEIFLETLETTPIRSQIYWIVVGEGASLVIRDDVQKQAVALRHIHIQQREGSSLSFMGLRAGNTFLHERIETYLNGHHAKAEITHLVKGDQKEQVDMEVSAYHRAPSTESTITARVAAGGGATIINRGLIDIDQHSGGSVGYESAQALILSPKAVVDMLPRLDIRTNDVRCSHGVTTTHLDDLALFYLRSRGLDTKEAEQLATLGFFHDRLAIPEDLKMRLEKVL